MAMGTKRRSISDRRGRTIFLVLLTPITTLNASQAMTFCVGHDGRVAIELLVQDRCTCELRSAEPGAQPTGLTNPSHRAGAPGLPCLDIPIPGGSSDCRTRTGLSSAQRQEHPDGISSAALPGQTLAHLPPAHAKPGGPDDATRRLRACVSYYLPLDNILLQV
jgi:hypothetical protein